MAEKDKLKAELILKVEAAKDVLTSARKAYEDAVADLAKVAPFTAMDYEAEWR